MLSYKFVVVIIYCIDFYLYLLFQVVIMIQKQIINSLNDVIQQYKDKFNNLNPILPQIAGLIEIAIIKNFDAGGRWDGKGTSILSGGTKKWHPLSENYKLQLIKRDGNSVNTNPTLRRSGILANSINVETLLPNSILISSNLEYAKTHQFGYKNMPARPFITLTNADVKDMIVLIKEMLQ